MSAHRVPWWSARAVSFPAIEGLERFLTREECTPTRRSGWRTKKHKRLLWRRFSWGGRIRCWWCRCLLRERRFEPDHVWPVCLGGADDLGNLVPACRGCNQRRGREQSRTFDELNVTWMLAEMRGVRR